MFGFYLCLKMWKHQDRIAGRRPASIARNRHQNKPRIVNLTLLNLLLFDHFRPFKDILRVHFSAESISGLIFNLNLQIKLKKCGVNADQAVNLKIMARRDFKLQDRANVTQEMDFSALN